MPATDTSTLPSCEIGFSLTSSEDRAGLRRALRHESVRFTSALGVGPALDSVDLFIVDPLALQCLREDIARLREAVYPRLVPVIVLARTDELPSDSLVAQLSDLVEDVICLPQPEQVLKARINAMRRLAAMSAEQSRSQRTARQALHGVSRALRTLDACNEVLLRERQEHDLLQQVCTVITRFEGYPLAWVGFTEVDPDDPAQVVIAAMSGPATGYAKQIEVRGDDSRMGQGPVGRALVSGQTQIFDDLRNNPAMQPWQAFIEQWALGSAIALPMTMEWGGRGVLAVYSSQPGDFALAERELLERLALNLSVAVDKLRLREQRERQQAEIHELFYSDLLTGLPNRRYLEHRLESALTSASTPRMAAALFIDLADFKLVNDALGYHAGDQVLKQVAQRIKRVMRAPDLLARKGEDEFIALMVAPQPRTAHARQAVEQVVDRVEALVERLLESIRRPISIGGVRHRIDAAIGVSLMPHLASTPAALVEQAETAMYQAKRHGKERLFYTRELGLKRQQRLNMESRLHRALENEEFFLNYQPVWELDSGRIVGVEALLRWQDPAGQRISPGAFIPVAEEIGLIGPIGDWVLQTAARQLAQWRARGLPLWISVNLSVSQLQASRAATRIADLVDGHLSGPEGLTLELTEDTLMRSPERVLNCLNELNERGFRLSLDDFGKGYSSLARLQTLPLHTLKIDKLFVDQLEGPGSGSRIVRAITELARYLQLDIVAEGIETAVQRERLSEMGPLWGQGFLMSAACDPDSIIQMIAHQTDRASQTRI